jgi:inosose dehydratase
MSEVLLLKAMTIRIGTAPDSWGIWFASDRRQTPASRFLEEVAEAGYKWIELGPYGYLPTNPAELKSALKRHNLQVSASFVMGHIEQAASFARMEKEVLLVGALLQECGAQYLVLIDDTYTDLFTGEPTGATRLKPEEWKRLLEGTNFLARLAAEKFGLKLTFHPHAQTHVESEEQIEELLEGTDPAYVSLCLDTGHHAYCGGEPVRFLAKHFSRVAYLHLKSVDAEKQRMVAQTQSPFARAVELGVFCEPSEGVVDFVALTRLLKERSYEGWATVEQDMFPTPFDRPLPIARRTRAYLKEIGLG